MRKDIKNSANTVNRNIDSFEFHKRFRRVKFELKGVYQIIYLQFFIYSQDLYMIKWSTFLKYYLNTWKIKIIYDKKST